MNHGYPYQDVLVASQRIDWHVEDLIRATAALTSPSPSCPKPWRGWKP